MDELRNKEPKQLLGRREKTMIPITQKKAPPAVPPKPSMINFVGTKSSSLRYQTMKSTKDFSQPRNLRSSLSSQSISATNYVKSQADSLKFKKCQSVENNDGSFLLEANKVKLSDRPELNCKEKRNLKFPKFWKKTQEEKQTKKIIETKTHQDCETIAGTENENVKRKSNFSKKMKSFGFKKGAATTTPRKPLSQTDQIKSVNKLGNSIVLLSPNDTEMRGHDHKVNNQRHAAHDPVSALPRLSKVMSSRDNLSPIISNPRNKFIQPRRVAKCVTTEKDKLIPEKDKSQQGRKKGVLRSTGSATVTLV